MEGGTEESTVDGRQSTVMHDATETGGWPTAAVRCGADLQVRRLHAGVCRPRRHSGAEAPLYAGGACEWKHVSETTRGAAFALQASAPRRAQEKQGREAQERGRG